MSFLQIKDSEIHEGSQKNQKDQKDGNVLCLTCDFNRGFKLQALG